MSKETHYVRDGSGNVLAIYENKEVNELVIYGSSRLGSYNAKTDEGKRTLGNKKYELSNHLGNVLSVITDNKIGIGSNGIADYYEPLVISESDYYPFGMAMTERSFENEEYRFGFNTQEKTPEIGEDTYTAEFWQYDSKVARRWNVDPIDKPWESSYLVNNGNPVRLSDPKGDDTRIKKKKRRGKTHYKLKYRGVLIDKTGTLSRRELREYRKAINKQLKETFNDEDEGASWKIKVRLRIGKKARRSDHYKESTVNLIENGYVVSQTVNGKVVSKETMKFGASKAANTLDAYVNINKFGGSEIDKIESISSVARVAVHEIAHTMGLPHIVNETLFWEDNTVVPFYEKSLEQIDLSIVKDDFVHKYNLMQAGYFPHSRLGKKVTSSQIERIHYSYKKRIINSVDKFDFRGRNWGDIDSDRDVYRFYLIKLEAISKTIQTLNLIR